MQNGSHFYSIPMRAFNNEVGMIRLRSARWLQARHRAFPPDGIKVAFSSPGHYPHFLYYAIRIWYFEQ